MKKETAMKERLHEQISEELKQNTRTDTIVIIVAIVLNLLFLGINSGAAGAIRDYDYRNGAETVSINPTAVAIMVILMVVIVAINFFVLRIMSRGKERRAKLMAGMMKMYHEEGMEQYYDASVEKGYEARYNLFSAVVISLGAVAVLVPILVSSTSC